MLTGCSLGASETRQPLAITLMFTFTTTRSDAVAAKARVKFPPTSLLFMRATRRNQTAVT